MSEIVSNEFIVTTLLAALRIGAMLAVAPMFGTQWVAWRFRIALALILTLLVAPMIKPSELDNLNVVEAIAGEILCGLLFGLGIRLTIMSLGFAGDLISQMTGWSLGQNGSDEDGGSSPLGKLFSWTMIATFVASSGPNQLVAGLMKSFENRNPGSISMQLSDTTHVTWLLQQSFELSLRVAAPALVSLIIATLVLALIQRSAPTVNSFQVGFALKSVLAFAVASIVIAQGPNLVTNYVEPTMDRIQDSIGTSGHQDAKASRGRDE